MGVYEVLALGHVGLVVFNTLFRFEEGNTLSHLRIKGLARHHLLAFVYNAKLSPHRFLLKPLGEHEPFEALVATN